MTIQPTQPGLCRHLYARRRQRREPQPLRPDAQRRHLSRRNADHDDPRRARRSRLRHRAHRGAGRAARHALRRELAIGHDPHHHQQARSRRVLAPPTASKVNAVDHGGIGGGAEGYVNAPLSDNAAIRIVGWAQHDAGYIDNVPGDAALSDARASTDDNFDIAEDNYNDVDTYGARAALQHRSQRQLDRDAHRSWRRTRRRNGVFFYDPAVGDLAVTHWFPENGSTIAGCLRR